MERDQFDIRAEIDGRNKPSYGPEKKSRTRRDRQTSSPTRKPRAPEMYSMLAQAWYDNAVGVGFDLPYDVNYFALALEERVSRDTEIQKFLEKGKKDQVTRWIQKMVDLWWSPVDSDGRGGYITQDVTSRNAKDLFLGEDWNDLRDYARSCLRAAYLVEYGRRVPPPLYPQQQEYQQRLEDLQKQHQISTWLEDAVEHDLEPVKVDETARERLRSFAEKRRKK